MSSDPFEPNASEQPAANPYQSPLESSMAMPPPIAMDDHLAGRMNRLGAVILDGIIALAISGPIMYFTGYFDRAFGGAVSITELVLQTLGGIVLFLLLNGYFLATRGQTLGKMAAGIRIVAVDTGDLVPLGKLIGLRYLPLWVVQSIPFVNILGIVDALFIFREDRRCIHDLLAGTHVVNV